MYWLGCQKKNPKKAPSTMDYVLKSAVAPGWAQFSKGHDTRAWIIIGGESVFVSTMIGAAISKYYFRGRKNATYDKGQNNKWEHYKELVRTSNTVYGIMLQATVAVYVYNLLDAAIAKDSLHMAVVPNNNGTLLLAKIDF